MEVKERWEEVQVALGDIDQYITTQAARIKNSNDVNISKWPINRKINKDEKLDFDKAILRMKKAYSQRFNAVDSFVRKL